MITDSDLLGIPVLTLAYLGDSVFETLVRGHVIAAGRKKNTTAHHAAVALTSAPAQAELARALFPLLTEEEQRVFTRGKNSSPKSVPRSCTAAQYALATALETVFGWLKLKEADARAAELFDGIME
jgi:ribonuclease-3 family protein